MIIFKVNVEGVFPFKHKRHAPIATHRDAPSVGAIAFQPMQAITRQVHVSKFLSRLEAAIGIEPMNKGFALLKSLSNAILSRTLSSYSVNQYLPI